MRGHTGKHKQDKELKRGRTDEQNMKEVLQVCTEKQMIVQTLRHVIQETKQACRHILVGR